MEVELRKWKIEDARFFAQSLSNKKILDNLRDGIPYPYTIDDAKEYIEYILNRDNDDIIVFAIIADGDIVGNISVERCDNIHFRTGEMGYYIAQEYWGLGIGSMAIKLMCKYIFENTDIIRIFAEPFAYNKASCRILEKNGFMLEGTLRCNAVKNDEIVDMRMYSLIKE